MPESDIPKNVNPLFVAMADEVAKIVKRRTGRSVEEWDEIYGTRRLRLVGNPKMWKEAMLQLFTPEQMEAFQQHYGAEDDDFELVEVRNSIGYVTKTSKTPITVIRYRLNREKWGTKNLFS